jgi:hypothetical protein
LKEVLRLLNSCVLGLKKISHATLQMAAGPSDLDDRQSTNFQHIGGHKLYSNSNSRDHPSWFHFPCHVTLRGNLPQGWKWKQNALMTNSAYLMCRMHGSSVNPFLICKKIYLIQYN